MYGQMTAGSWIYIGTQGIVQGTFETFAAVAAQRFGGSLARPAGADRRLRRDGRRAAPRGHDARRRLPGRRRRPAPARAARRDALPRPRRARPRHRAARDRGGARPGDGAPIGLVANAAEVYEELLRRGVVPDVVTDQTSAHDPLGGYVPDGLTLDEAAELRESRPEATSSASRAAMARQCAAMVAFQERGAEVFDYGNNLRTEARHGRLRARLRLPGLRAGLHPAAVLPRASGRSAWPRCRATRTTSPPPTRALRRALPRERGAAALAAAGAGADRLPGPAGAHLLARLRRAAPRRPAAQRAGALGRDHARRS